MVLELFNHRCVACGSAQDLTFDHYALTKNEGGNFVLIPVDRASIRLNIIVLCKSCNSAKSQFEHLLYFSDEQRQKAEAFQGVLLKFLLNDKEFLKIVKKWGL